MYYKQITYCISYQLDKEVVSLAFSLSWQWLESTDYKVAASLLQSPRQHRMLSVDHSSSAQSYLMEQTANNPGNIDQ